jgi:outer membrane protein assembly factor BamB
MTEGKVIAFQTSTNIPSLAWECDAGLGYDIAPSLISESGNAVLVATDKGIIVAIDKTSRQVVWKYKLSEALINGITPLSMNCYLVSTLDGHIACIEIKLK